MHPDPPAFIAADYYEADSVPYHLSYYFPVQPGTDSLFNVLYFFDAKRRLTGVTISLEHFVDFRRPVLFSVDYGSGEQRVAAGGRGTGVPHCPSYQE